MEAEVKIGSKFVGDDYPCFIVGEIGINHNGDVEIAKKLIDLAAEAGCDAVKFQKRTIDVVYTKEELERPRESPFGATNGDLKRGLEFDFEQYEAIDRHCKERGIIWFASCWDEASVDFIERFNPPCYKIASACLTDRSLLRKHRMTGKPIILSSGMSAMRQVLEAVKILDKKMLDKKDLIILHCVSTYPSQNSEINLRVIQTLKEFFPNVPIGYSGHEPSVKPSVYAVCYGACLVERHITLDRTMWGSDQAASLGPMGLKLLVSDIRIVEEVRGDGIKRLLESEIPIIKKLRRKADF